MQLTDRSERFPVSLRQAKNFLLLIAALVWSAPRANAERILEHYDIDSLSALATLIVKAELGEPTDVKTPDGDFAVWDVTVLSRLQGDARVNTKIRVACIEEYRKGPGIEGNDGGVERLSAGDIVYLFLAPKDAPGGYAKYRATDADWKVVRSGARLVAGKKVYSFGQYWPKGGSSSLGFVAMTRETFPKAGDAQEDDDDVLVPVTEEQPAGDVPIHTVESFEKKVRASLKYVADLRRKLSGGQLKVAERKAILDSRAEVLKREWAKTDHIPQLLGK